MIESYDESEFFPNLKVLNFEGNNYSTEDNTYQNNNLNTFNYDDILYYHSFKNDSEKGKETRDENNIFFKINRDVPQILLKNEISYFIKNKMKVSERMKNILNNESYLENSIIEDVEKKLIKKDIVKKYKKKNKETENIIKKKLGRKRINDESIRNHNKYSSDNIINKIKTVLKKYIIIFVNNIINYLYTEKIKDSILLALNFPKNSSLELIKNVDYKRTANIKKKRDNLNLLGYSLQKFLSFNVSGRYSVAMKKNEELITYNQKVIKEFLLKDERNYEIFNFVLNGLKFEDFLGLFIHTKDLTDFPSFNSLNNSNKKIIENCLVPIETYLRELYEENDEVYLICFLLLIFNFKRYYSIKAERESKSTKFNKK